jgi:hypothetical protein
LGIVRDLRFSIRPLQKEPSVSLEMLHVERARTRMPLACTVISLLALAVLTALCTVSWLLETNKSSITPANATHSNHPATDASDAETPDPYATESWVRHGREF